MRKLKNFVFATITLIVTLVVVDLALHLAASVSPYVNSLVAFVPAKLPDDRLGHVLNPDYPEHDSNGFRNPRVLESADIVALGDSQTYGSGVESGEAWPHVLARLSGRSVYSMSAGGYGPLHSLLLWDDAMRLKPGVVVEAVYAGNDMYDAFNLVYRQGGLSEYRIGNPDIKAQIDRAQAEETIQSRVSRMYRRGRTKAAGNTRVVKDWLYDNSKIVGLIKRFQHELKQRRKAGKAPLGDDEKWARSLSFAEKYSDYAYAFEDSISRTVFTPEYRLAALDLNDPRIAEGQRILIEALRSMRRRAEAHNVRLVVLFIPTKELVFYQRAAGIESDSYRELIELETEFWNSLRELMASESIEYIDALPALRAKLDAGEQPYKLSHNGHPNAVGQAEIAAVVNRYLQK